MGNDAIIRKLYQKYFAQPTELLVKGEKGGTTIAVNEILSKASFFYERIRNALEYSEEHLLRKNAIARILSRRLFFQKKSEEVAESLILELIRARYLPNRTLSDKMIPIIAKTIHKYQRLLNTIEKNDGLQKRQKAFKWTIGIAASEIESQLADTHQDEAFATYMYEIFEKNLPEELKNIPKEELSIQLFIAIEQSLLKADKILISHRLLERYVPHWKHASNDTIEKMATCFENIRNALDAHFKHQRTDTLYRWTKKYTVLFLLLRDLLEKHEEDFANLLNDKQTLKEEIEAAYKRRAKIIRRKITRGVARSIIYIFFTKMLIALLLEIPYDRYVHGELALIPLEINIMFPPILMFILGITIRMPKKENLKKIQEVLPKMIYNDALALTPPKKLKRKTFFSIIFTTLYTLTYAVSFGGMIYVLSSFGFNTFSGALFLLFLCLASFLGFRLRQHVKEVSLIERRENIITLLVGFLTTPFLRVGNWISTKFSRINIFLFILDIIIEAPFQLIIEVLEQWFSYMKEKRDELS
ncbi:MAG: hypothetical protein A3B74_00165 [Candidatus Kerfeldbacteria bacterium RIFCSPHIGHO2_02_FULL_42_14]|uniref:Uncharacterized protein n=1 Tax=Candidatus Kerfeldbacteria bacterium RIFCSPHIGHO2_02_FULL_42_14 TaxID=1798540 RepID=A0A1G2ARY7_9BACT|nr:MAG: hypothetical protein A3B74_00165 [Candidatus Kerfeldbacteria bacterium RIFCSPHIGHO2_02_FULL_42_14]OGY81309.1 MAG: hypothetical protein A3E60_02575 [Candidatus Kerfeldbacteria bacterium RIFCSPHIGHO2_12_FULL_42_13]OGY83583.1 MAG: hypothetical protein A3I91_03005 [Candidatus Kerfeldbacteria bacterium RIFCSPLOWO2_02_FULL_42_19]OGY86703.1 MAG: hypothetical protein A3G01_00620 [Candidatus Kerfeldbacteria bacterium RIFCSPLOWO2_12_FULL_43_9]